MSDNGNCLYYAISYSLFGCVDYHEDLREKVADWLAANGEYQLVSLSLLLLASSSLLLSLG